MPSNGSDRPIVEERHRPDYPWPTARARGVVVESRSDAVLVKWDSGSERWYDKDRIGSKMTDLIRFTGDYAPGELGVHDEQNARLAAIRAALPGERP